MRLIDADALIDGIKHKLWDWESIDGITATTVLKQTITDIENQPTVLLKEQEAVEPQTQPSAKGYWFTCGACGWWLFEVRDTVHFDDRKRIRFCASCGQAVKWE